MIGSRALTGRGWPLASNQYLVAPSSAKGGSISFGGFLQLLGFCVFEACVGIFWPSIMKMRSQYIPEEARSTIMNFFRIPLNIFVCIVLYNVSIPLPSDSLSLSLSLHTNICIKNQNFQWNRWTHIGCLPFLLIFL